MRSSRAYAPKRPRCPHCGSRTGLEDNGASPGSHDYTLLCTARVAPGGDAFGGEASPPLEVGEDGMVSCGMQWMPNEGA